MLFVARLKALEDLYGFLSSGRLDHDLLKTPCKRVVFFDVFSIFVKSCRTYALDFTTSQSWLENVGRIDGSLCSTGSDERVKFVDEQNGVLGSSNFVHHRFDAFFELSTILRSSNHHRQIENNDPLIR